MGSETPYLTGTMTLYHTQLPIHVHMLTIFDSQLHTLLFPVTSLLYLLSSGCKWVFVSYLKKTVERTGRRSSAMVSSGI